MKSEDDNELTMMEGYRERVAELDATSKSTCVGVCLAHPLKKFARCRPQRRGECSRRPRSKEFILN